MKIERLGPGATFEIGEKPAYIQAWVDRYNSGYEAQGDIGLGPLHVSISFYGWFNWRLGFGIHA